MITAKKASSHSQLACRRRAGEIGRGRHDHIGQRQQEIAQRHLGDGRGFLAASSPGGAQNMTTSGVKAKIMKGLKAWNQVTGICQSIMPGISARLVKFCAHRLIVLPCCS